jgi:hypothetical protein
MKIFILEPIINQTSFLVIFESMTFTKQRLFFFFQSICNIRLINQYIYMTILASVTLIFIFYYHLYIKVDEYYWKKELEYLFIDFF